MTLLETLFGVLALTNVMVLVAVWILDQEIRQMRRDLDALLLWK